MRLFLCLILISPFSFADWGDVYSCQETSSSGITLEGKRTDYRLEKFQFSLDKTKNAMVFGSSGHFVDTVVELIQGKIWPNIEQWKASDEHSMFYFKEGKFLSVSLTMGAGSSSKSADCEKF